ncbi:glycosyltransferase family 2 protein [Actinoplanes sp. NPDC051470]|uniref:glycosyltransferase family 2 protein n=1 Tax=Actinoplanes sp. NPDC051470 TaxID=3157224 RepID=UPI003414B0F4
MPPSRPTVSVVLPALDEAANIAHVLHGLPDVVDEVIVVDGGSSDDTVAVARQSRAGTHVVRQTRSGKGNALACGIAASRGDIVVLMSADGSCDPSDIPRFVQALAGGADAAHGSRFRGRGGDLESGRLERLGGHLLRHRVNKVFQTRYTDLGSGYHAFWRATLDKFDLPDPELPGLRRGETVWGDGPEVNPLIPVRMAALGLRVVEIATVRYPRIHGAPRPRRTLARILRGRRVLRAERRRVSRLDQEEGKSTTMRGYARSTRTTADRPGEHTTGRHARPEAPRRPYPGPRPDWADSVGQHRTEDMIGNSRRRSGIYESGVHQGENGSIRRSGLYDTGVHRTGVYDTGVHRTEIYDTGEVVNDRVPREVGGGRRRLDAEDRTPGPPQLTAGPSQLASRPPQLMAGPPQLTAGPAHLGPDENMPYAGRPGYLRTEG